MKYGERRDVRERRTKLLLDLDGRILDSLVDIIVAQSEPGQMSIRIPSKSACKYGMLT